MIVPGPDNSAFRAIRGILYVWIVVLVLALDPRTEDPATPVKLLVSAAAAVSMMLLWALALGTNRAPYRCINPPLRFLGIFFGVLGIAALLSKSPDRGLQALCPWLIFAAIGFVAYQTIPHARHLRNLFRVLVACVTLSSVYGLAQYFGWDPFPWANRSVEEYRALPATYGNPNLAGHALVVSLVLCAGLVADAWQRKRWPVELAAYLVLAGVMATHLALTQMRGGVVALAIVLVFVAVWCLARRVGFRGAGEAGIALAACAVVFALVAAAALALAPRLGLDSSLQLRLNSYAGAADLFLEHPWFGVGPGSYAFYNISHWSPFEALWYALKNKRNFNVHNEWLEMAVEGGIPGLAVFIGIFLVSVITFFEHPRLPGERHRALWMAIPAAIVALGADACFGFNLHAPVSAAFFFLLIGLQAAQPYYSAPTGKMVRRALVPLCLLTLAVAWSLWCDYGYERSYQRAQGAVAWSRTHDEGGTDLEPIGSLLETLTRVRPDDYRGWMLRGDFALERDRAGEAVAAYREALLYHSHLPRLHVQLGRALIRVAQERNGAEALSALETAEAHALLAQKRCPDLAEARAMTGWCSYVRSTLPATDQADLERAHAVESFERARALGLPAEEGVDGALGDLYARANDWSHSAAAWERCVKTTPGNWPFWVQWSTAAAQAGDDASDQFQQALLYHLGRFTAGDEMLAPELAAWIGGRLSALALRPGEIAVADRALGHARAAAPSVIGFWSAGLGLTPEGARRDKLAEAVAAVPEERRGEIPSAITALNTALQQPDSKNLAGAAQSLAQSLATAPGSEHVATVHAPLVDLLNRAVRVSGQSDGELGTVLNALGAASFEAGDLPGAVSLLQRAEAVLSGTERAQALYYHSRALVALGQHALALSMAKEALDGGGGAFEYQWQLARCLAVNGHSEAARFAYESLGASLPPDHPYRPLVERAREALSGPGAAP